MSHYHDSDDLKILGEMKTLAPVEFGGFLALDKVVGRDDGAIPRKYRELIAVAVACTTQCPYCLDVTHGALALKLFDEGKGDRR
jgi:AhpD family alkylhydroperoxidase